MYKTAGPIITKPGTLRRPCYKGRCQYCTCEFIYNDQDIRTKKRDRENGLHIEYLTCPQKGCDTELIMFSDSPASRIEFVYIDPEAHRREQLEKQECKQREQWMQRHIEQLYE